MFGYDDGRRYCKDGINDCVVHGARDAVNPGLTGTRVAAHYPIEVASGGSAVIRLRLTDNPPFDGIGPDLGRTFS